MSQRYVYLVDADGNLNAHLVGELARYGFRVEAAIDSNELMQRKDDLPSLIVLCIDPKRTGWAVCNRLRKSTTLKSTPLIITSAEATEKDFEDHKKLKTRAEEYLHKPFGVEALAEMVGGLIGMPDPSEYAGGTQSLEIPMESEEVAIEDDAAIIEEAPDEALYEEAQPSTQHAVAFGDGEDDDNTRIGVMNVDGEVDVETEAAFAAIGMDGLEDQTNVSAVEPPLKPMLARVMTAKKAVPMPSVTEVPMDEAFGDDDDPFSLPRAASTVPAPLPPAESQPIDTFRAQQQKDQSGPIRPRARRGGRAGVARAGAAAAAVEPANRDLVAVAGGVERAAATIRAGDVSRARPTRRRTTRGWPRSPSSSASAMGSSAKWRT